MSGLELVVGLILVAFYLTWWLSPAFRGVASAVNRKLEQKRRINANYARDSAMLGRIIQLVSAAKNSDLPAHHVCPSCQGPMLVSVGHQPCKDLRCRGCKTVSSFADVLYSTTGWMCKKCGQDLKDAEPVAGSVEQIEGACRCGARLKTTFVIGQDAPCDKCHQRSRGHVFFNEPQDIIGYSFDLCTACRSIDSATTPTTTSESVRLDDTREAFVIPAYVAIGVCGAIILLIGVAVYHANEANQSAVLMTAAIWGVASGLFGWLFPNASDRCWDRTFKYWFEIQLVPFAVFAVFSTAITSALLVGFVCRKCVKRPG